MMAGTKTMTRTIQIVALVRTLEILVFEKIENETAVQNSILIHYEFESGPNEIFFPIGLNLADDCKCEMHEDINSNDYLECDECYYAGCSDVCATLYSNDREGAYMTTQQTPVLAHMMKFEERINAIADAGANSFRMIWQPHMYDLEFEQVGNYCKRLTSAWEFDHLVNLCKDKELRIEVCQQIHHTLELQAHYSRFNWDWGFQNICGSNPSFDYRDEFDLTDPLAFLTDDEAIDWYKNKLRYIYARWGYSPNIYLWDLFSEMNNIGYESETNIDCSAGGDVNEMLPYDDEDTKEDYRVAISNWNEEMSNYIKNDLNQKNQLLTTCYTGAAPLANGCLIDCFDDTFCGEDIDVVSWNDYSLGHERWKNMAARPHIPIFNFGDDYYGGDYYRMGKLSCDTQHDFYNNDETTWISNKPIINSENGLGDAVMQCDETGWYKDLYVSAFSGRASTGMSWDETGNPDIWPEFGKLRYFLENYFFNEVDLEEDVWYPGWEEMNSDDILDTPNYVECAYLEFPEPDHRRFVGVIINRTWNHSNTNNGEAPCINSLPPGDHPVANDSKTATDIYYDNDDDLKLKFWDGNETAQTYNIEYFYPDDLDEPAATDNVNCILGKLTLKNFPPLLLSSPIVFFRAKRDGDSFNTKMAYAESNGANSSGLSIESTTLLVDNSNRRDDCQIFVVTNPVADILNIRGTCIFEEVALIIYDLASRQVYNGEVSNIIDPIDVSSLSSGVYILSINGQQIPFMKL